MKVSLREALARVPSPKGERFAVAFERGSMSVEVYAPRGADPQSPHTRDELYFVAQGQGTFVCGDRSDRFGPGDCLFVPARVEHRFLDFTDDLVVWVVFYGPEGGEHPLVRQVLGRTEQES
jgi:mannose-6-phosphate isomerase-like protein (cupin superfamily)